MARFGQGLIQGLTNPQFQQGLFELGDRIAERRRNERELQAIQGAATLGNQGVSFAQAGNVQELQNTITQLTEQLGQAKNVNTAAQIQSQINKLQALIPETKQISTRNSINTVMGIDAKLKNQDALKRSMQASNPKLTDAEFNAEIAKLEQQRKDLLAQDTLINEGYQGRRLALSQAQAQQEELQARTWLSDNRSKILAAIETGRDDAIKQSIADAPAAIAERAQEFVDRQIRSHNEMLDLRERTISMKNAPDNTSFKSQIESINAGLSEGDIEYNTTVLETLNTQYENHIAKTFKDGKWTSLEDKSRAAALERLFLDEYQKVQRDISTTQYDVAVRRQIDIQKQVDALTLERETFVPSPQAIENEAELLASTDPTYANKDFKDIPPAAKAAFLAEAEETIRDEYDDIRLIAIARLDPDAVEKAEITAGDRAVLEAYPEADRDLIMEEYNNNAGIIPIAEIIKGLNREGAIDTSAVAQEILDKMTRSEKRELDATMPDARIRDTD